MNRLAAILLVCAAGCQGLDDNNAHWMSMDELSGMFTPEVGSGTRRAMAAGGTLRVVTYNIRDGGADPTEIAAAFRANGNLANADVVMLQEAVFYPGEGTTRISRLAQELDMGWIYAPARPDKDGTLGDAIISRYPLSDFAVMHLPIAPRKRQRIAVAATVSIGDQDVRLVTTHLDTSLNITDRVLQLRPAVIELPEVALVGGDFNTNPYAWQEGEVPLVPTSQIVDTDQAPALDDYMDSIGFSNPTAALGNTEVRYGIESRLDAVFVRGMTYGDRGIERDVTLSDHWPVWVDVKTLP
ncbi:MAG: hypothetical protein HOV81_00860 [Kofleriaceae bacterium]|nr:hypothetical protein [Kofleriaceae bacterium]